MNGFPEKILLATDGSEDASLAARMAGDLSRKVGCELHLVYAEVVPGFYYSEPALISAEFWEQLSSAAEKEARSVVDRERAKLEEAGATVTAAHATVGRTDERIVGLAEKIGADLILIGSRGLGGIRRALMGSVSDSVVRHAHCPVLVVRHHGRQKENTLPKKILLAVDGSKESENAARLAANFASGVGSELHIVRVLPTVPEMPYPNAYVLEQYKASFEDTKEEVRAFLDNRKKDALSGGVEEVFAHLRLGRSDREIVRLGEELDADLIFIGNRGLDGLSRALLGSVSLSVVRHAHCPVLVARNRS